jgi:hypothetical protein
MALPGKQKEITVIPQEIPVPDREITVEPLTDPIAPPAPTPVEPEKVPA